MHFIKCAMQPHLLSIRKNICTEHHKWLKLRTFNHFTFKNHITDYCAAVKWEIFEAMDDKFKYKSDSWIINGLVSVERVQQFEQQERICAKGWPLFLHICCQSFHFYLKNTNIFVHNSEKFTFPFLKIPRHQWIQSFLNARALEGQ